MSAERPAEVLALVNRTLGRITDLPVSAGEWPRREDDRATLNDLGAVVMTVRDTNGTDVDSYGTAVRVAYLTALLHVRRIAARYDEP